MQKIRLMSTAEIREVLEQILTEYPAAFEDIARIIIDKPIERNKFTPAEQAVIDQADRCKDAHSTNPSH